MGIDAATITVARIRVAWTVTSDRRYKENIQDIPLGISFIKALRPVSYHRVGNKNNDIESGLIAQELEAALQKAGSKDLGIIHKDAKGYYSVRYNDLLPPMIKAMQEQQDMIEQLQKENTQLKAENKNFEARLTNIETMLTSIVKPDNSISEDKR